MERFPAWMWFVVGVALLLIVMVLLKVDFRAGRSGISIDQNLVK